MDRERLKQATEQLSNCGQNYKGSAYRCKEDRCRRRLLGGALVVTECLWLNLRTN